MTDSDLKISFLSSKSNEKISASKGIEKPLERANFFQRLFFFWVFPILKVQKKLILFHYLFFLKLGNKVYLEQNMLYDLRKKDDSKSDYEHFEKVWSFYKTRPSPLLCSLYHTFKR